MMREINSLGGHQFRWEDLGILIEKMLDDLRQDIFQIVDEGKHLGREPEELREDLFQRVLAFGRSRDELPDSFAETIPAVPPFTKLTSTTPIPPFEEIDPDADAVFVFDKARMLPISRDQLFGIGDFLALIEGGENITAASARRMDGVMEHYLKVTVFPKWAFRSTTDDDNDPWVGINNRTM